jgi:hypothetical protein
MKAKFLALSSPCSENWENMTPDGNGGNYCDRCAKTVIDFTQLDQSEIAKVMKSGRQICARVTKMQMAEPLALSHDTANFSLPYSNVAAGLMIATTLAATQPSQAQQRKESVSMATMVKTRVKTDESRNQPSAERQQSNTFVNFKGVVNAKTSGKPVANAQIMLVTVSRQITSRSLADGSFSMKIPSDLIDDENVIRMTYNDVGRQNDSVYGFETEDYILTRKQIHSPFKVKAEDEMMVFGAMYSSFRSDKNPPIVLVDGIDVKFKEFTKARGNHKSTVSLKNKSYMYFRPKEAVAIYDERASSGLYIVTTNAQKSSK